MEPDGGFDSSAVGFFLWDKTMNPDIEPDSIPPKIERNKLIALVASKRTLAAVAAAMVVLLGPEFELLDQELALAIVTTIASWIFSDSIRPTDNVFTSRRFHVMVATGLVAVAANFGFNLNTELLIGLVSVVVSWIVGEGIRPALAGDDKRHQKDLYRRPPKT